MMMASGMIENFLRCTDFERDVDPSAVHINRALDELDNDRDEYISLKECMCSKTPDWTKEEKKVERQWREEYRGEKVARYILPGLQWEQANEI